MDAMTTLTMQTTLYASKSDFRMTQFKHRAIAIAVTHSCSQQNEKYEYD